MPKMKVAKREPVLITHRHVALMCDMTTETLRRRVGRGTWPEPHSIVERMWYYRRTDIQAYIDTGEWPPTMRFKPCEAATQIPRRRSQNSQAL